VECMQYTVRGVPGYMDEGIRAYAQEKAMSLNSAFLEIMASGLGLLKRKNRNDKLTELAGSWVEDPEMEKAFSEMDRVDEDMWK